MKIKKGQLLILSSGAYSGYSVLGLYRVVKDFDTAAIGLDEKFPSNNLSWGYSDIPKYLVERGYLVEEEHREWYLGDYQQTINTVLCD